MSEPFIGEIQMFAGNFAPRSWALCDGQLLAISQNDALFSLLGTTYGGDGRTTFGLPDLRGRIPIHMGTGPGLSPRSLGSKAGTENETITSNQLPAHGHPVKASSSVADASAPGNRVVAESSLFDLYQSAAPSAVMSSSTVGSSGSNQSHGNVMPFQCVNFIIALVGVYPSRN
jgi:microcystin-dependent protein